jgi:non-canonical (house-cleaning) NTP pyrophosphatase
VQLIGTHWFDSGWAVVVDAEGREGIGSTLRLSVPPLMMEMITQGRELGEVIDIVFQQRNSKQSVGHFGLMTNNALTRTNAYADGVVSALARFLHPEVFA